jgi:hypothetical protein
MTNIYKFVCEDIDDNGNSIPNTGCGPVDHLLFDGYYFGDRILEGVMFKVKLDGSVETVEDWSTHPYFSGLNAQKWLKEAARFIEDRDVCECTSALPNYRLYH